MLYLDIKRDGDLSVSKQICDLIRDKIHNGTLLPNEKMPSTRELAKYNSISRNTVIESYEQLLCEGYIYTKNGSGSYVSAGTILSVTTKQAYEEFCPETTNSDIVKFTTGIPDLSMIPVSKWCRTYNKVLLDSNENCFNYRNTYGEYKLRYQLAKYLKRVRGVNATSENIMITSGAAQAFSLICSLCGQNEYAAVENPLSFGIVNTLKSKKVKIYPIELDGNGMITSALPKTPPKLIFTTPSHQFPSGVILPAKRRIELIEYARLNSSYVVEDDYDSEFRYSGNPIQSMQALDPEHVIYIGTFSKTFMPSLRLGYVVLPKKLSEIIKHEKYVDDLHSSVPEQLTMAEFIASGAFDLHITKMRKVYLKRRNILIKLLCDTFGDNVSISGEQAGLHLVATFNDVIFDKELIEKLKENKVEVTALSKHYIGESNFCNHSLVLGYGNTDESKIKIGIKRLESITSRRT